MGGARWWRVACADPGGPAEPQWRLQRKLRLGLLAGAQMQVEVMVEISAEISRCERVQIRMTAAAGQKRFVALERQGADCNANAAMLVPDLRADHRAMSEVVVTAVPADAGVALVGQRAPAACERRSTHRHAEMVPGNHVEAGQRAAPVGHQSGPR